MRVVRRSTSLKSVDPLRRPRSLDPHELGFTPRRAVPWLAPLLLLRTGLRSLLATIFGAYLDKRELQGALPSRTFRQNGTDGEIWLDYVADLGDGFDATYTVAYLLGQPSLTVDGHQLPRGQVLIMGGDQAYPTASMQEYEDRCKGPYTAALPTAPVDGPQPTLYALPGNHDWYDGLTAFLRVFVGERTDHIGGWRIEQSRSYFALELPHSWWVFAVDEAFGAYLDDPQLVYFEQAARQLGPGHKVILVFPTPGWTKAERDPKAYDTIDFFIRTIIAPTGAQVRVILAGDTHHYSRYSHPTRELVTCGGGGAYLAATHTLPERITVPPQESLVRKASPKREYDLAACYPAKERSRRLGWRVFGRLPRRNRDFLWLLGGVHLVLMLTLAGVLAETTLAEERLFSIPLALAIITVIGGTVAFAYLPPGGRKGKRHLAAGLAHGGAHLLLGVAGAVVWLRLPFVDLPWPWPIALAALLYAPVAALVASQLLAAYLLVASRFTLNVNELFAAQGIEDYKSFLRLHVAADGALTIYPIAVDRVCRRWRADPDATRPDAPWIVPADADAIRLRLAEPPVTLSW